MPVREKLENVTESDYHLFTKVFSNNGRVTWSGDYKKQYISALRAINDLTNRELSEIIVQKSAEEIYQTIKSLDVGLKLFKEFQKHYEHYARKAVELYKFKLPAGEKNELRQVESQTYDFSDCDDWCTIGVENNDSEIVIVIGKSSYQSSNIQLLKGNLNGELWDGVREAALNKSKSDFSDLISISAKLRAPKRMIIKLSIDLEKDFINISSDNFEIDQNGRRVSDSTFHNERKRAVMEVIQKLPLQEPSKLKVKQSLEQGNRSLITKKTLERMSKLREENIILIPTIQSFNREDTDRPENSEKVTSKLYNQKIGEILHKARAYYDSNGTLEGFFQEYEEHNTSYATITSDLLEDEHARRTSYHAYIIMIRDAGKFDKGIKQDGHLNGKVIDHVSVDFDYSDKILDIRNSRYSKEIYDVIIKKILDLP